MTFDELLARLIDQLQRQGRMSYGALKRRYDLDDAYLEDLSTPSNWPLTRTIGAGVDWWQQCDRILGTFQ